MTSLPFVRRTLATLRKAEFGFFGVRVMTCTQTPRRNGHLVKAGDFDLVVTLLRPLRTSWLIVGMKKKVLSASLRRLRQFYIRGRKIRRKLVRSDPPAAGSADSRGIR